MSPAYFTICSANYIAYALTLYHSLKENAPRAADNFTLFLADEIGDRNHIRDLPFRVVEGAELDLPNYWDMAMRYSVMEFNTAIKPACFEWLFNQYNQDAAVYLDPDILVLRPLQHVEKALADGAELVLTPHIMQPIDDDKFPGDLQILRTGSYNLGFAAIRKARDTTRLLKWWGRKLEADCRVDLENGIFVDQKYMDLAPAFCSKTQILYHAGYNVAYWNLMHRPVTQSDKGWKAAGVNLHFFHFSGVVFGRPDMFSKHQDRFQASDIGDANLLLQHYLSELERHGHASRSKEPYAFSSFANGTPIPNLVRATYAKTHPAKAVPREAAFGSDIAFALRPATESGHLHGIPISVLMQEAWRSRVDLQRTFSLESREGRDAFVRWFLARAPEEFGLSEAIMDRVVAQLPPAYAHVREEGRLARARRLVVQSALKHTARLRPIYRHLPESFRLRLRSGLMRTASLSPLNGTNTLSLKSRGALDPSLRKGIEVFGYFRAVSGIGEGVRRTVLALRQADIDFRRHTIAAHANNPQILEAPEDRRSENEPHENGYRVALFHFNADQTETALTRIDPDLLRGRYRIGYWAWELSEFPQAQSGALASYDEIWVPSNFVKQSLEKITRKPVHVVPHPIDAPERLKATRRDFALPSDRLIFLCSVDFNSYSDRKNPHGAYEAFRRAFEGRENDPDCPALIIKAHGSTASAHARDSMLDYINGDSRVFILDMAMSGRRYRALQSVCDGFISLHRSEGFGLNIAECMRIGKPVIATHYGGNAEYMNEDNAYCVPYELVPVPDGAYPHGRGQVWAEPDLDAAAKILRSIENDRDEALRKGILAQETIKRSYSPVFIGETIREHLARIDDILEAD